MTWQPTSRYVEKEQPAPTPKRYTITLVQADETRAPHYGEYFLDSDGVPDVAVIDFRTAEYPILRVVSREAK